MQEKKSCPVFDNLSAKTITLTVTQKCNLSCVYCYEHDKNGQDMTFEQAKEIIDREANLDDGHTALTVDFFGGEPLMNFALIKNIVEHYTTNPLKTPFRFFMTTNGTLVHGEIKDWFLKYKNIVYCGLSLDGNKKVQDLNRSNSYDLIDLEFFLKTYPNQSVKMTLYPTTIQYFAESVIELHKSGFGIACNLAYGVDWSSDKHFKLFEAQLKMLCDFYIENPKITPCTMLDRRLDCLSWQDEEEGKMQKWCGVKTYMRVYDVDGMCYPCQHFMPVSSGKHSPLLRDEMKIDEKIPLSLINEECQQCKVRRLCPTCYGANYVATGNYYRKDMSLCRYLKAQFLACSYLWAKKILDGNIEMSDVEKSNYARGIMIIQKELENI